MIRPCVLLAAALVGVLPPGLAQAGPSRQAASRIVGACGQASAFGETLGAKDLAGQAGPRGFDSRMFTPVQEYPPFETFVAMLSPDTERLVGVQAVGRLPNRTAALDWARAVLKAAGRNPDALLEDSPGVFSARLAEDRFVLEVRDEVLQVSCIDGTLMQAGLEEMGGKPRPPHRTEIAIPPSDACDHPDSRRRIVASLDDKLAVNGDNLMEQFLYSQRLQIWTAEQREVELPEDWWKTSFAPPLKEPMARLDKIHVRFTAERDRHDDAAACASAVEALRIANEVDAVSQAFHDARVARIQATPRDTAASNP